MTFPWLSSSPEIGKATNAGVKTSQLEGDLKGKSGSAPPLFIPHEVFVTQGNAVCHRLCSLVWEGSNFHHLDYPLDNSRDARVESRSGKEKARLGKVTTSEEERVVQTPPNRRAARATRLALTSAPLARIPPACSPRSAAQPYEALHIYLQFRF